jgi:hypothetical protein
MSDVQHGGHFVYIYATVFPNGSLSLRSCLRSYDSVVLVRWSVIRNTTHSILAYFLHFEKIKLGFWDNILVCLYIPHLLNTLINHYKTCITLMVPEPLAAAYSINPFHQSTYLYPRLSLLGNCSANTFPRQWIHARIELLDASFSVRSVSYQRRMCLCTPLSLEGNGSVSTFPRQRGSV